MLLPSAEEAHAAALTAQEQQLINHNRGRILTGAGEEAAQQLKDLAAPQGTDNRMVNPSIPGTGNRICALELLAGASGISTGAR
ncbi:hypothetical protein OG288_43535 [Streptomyces tauricus]|uniref:Uncharacterized protein n=1 Tax=Streptomyces tauricus TaxID=68274 RepID=A0ABZ1K050_9ACTN|nr:hypothetical protein [Streptomyces tauricus]